MIRPIDASDTPPKLDGPPKPPDGGPPKPPDGGPPKPPDSGPPKLPDGGPPKPPDSGPPKLPDGGPPSLGPMSSGKVPTAPRNLGPTSKFGASGAKTGLNSGGGLKQPEVDPEKAAALEPPGEDKQTFSVVRRAGLRKLKDWYTQWQAFDISGIPSKPLDFIEQEQAKLEKAIEAASSKKVGPKK